MLSMRGDTYDNINFIVDLSSTKLADLWPGYEYPPPTPNGVVWHTVQLLPKIIGARQESPTNECQTDEGLENEYKTHESLARTASITQEVIIKPSSEPAVEVMPGKGRRKGAKKYTKKHIDYLLDTVEEILPCGKMMWDNVSLHCNERDPDFFTKW